MPGIFGIAHTRDDASIPAGTIGSMQELLFHRTTFHRDPIYADRLLSAGRCHAAIINKEPQPFTTGAVSVWLDGEFYNHAEIERRFNCRHANDPGLLHQLYCTHEYGDFLPAIDGIFAAAIYDRPRERLLLLCDRYGMRHLYLSTRAGAIAWSSEIKSLTALPWVTYTIDENALSEFMRFGYFIGHDTWFPSIKLMPQAGIVRFSFTDGAIHRETYWSWDRIKRMDGAVDITQAGREWGRRFRAAVRKRVRPGEQAGLTLSGGLDSRAILAAFPEDFGQVQTATFGKFGSMDMVLAAKASAVKKARHHTFEITEGNWLPPRLAGVWETDGQLNLLDMHGIECLPYAKRFFTISLNGIGGDGIHGGSFLSARKQSTATTADPYGFRGRRFIRVGTMLDEPWMHVRMPFYDNDLMELTLSLPAAARRHSHFYRIALLETFPDYFRDIPWQKIGIPISAPEIAIDLIWFTSRIRDRLARKAGRYGALIYKKNDFTDCASWIRAEPARSIFERLLFSPKAIYPDYFNRKTVESSWRRHSSAGMDHSAELCRYLTIELWLQQLLNNAMRPDPATGGLHVPVGFY